MSDSNGPVRRRRIAGETKPAAPAKKTPAKKVPVGKKAAAKKSAPAPAASAAPAKKTAAKAAPTKAAPTKKATTAKTSGAATSSAPQTSKPQTSKPRTSQRTVAAPPPAAPVTTTKVPTVSRPVRSAKPTTAAPATESGSGSGPSRRDLLWLVPVTLVAVASLVAGVFLLVGGINDKGDDSTKDGLETSRRQASSAAASAAETIFSFRFDELPEHLKASKALMTPAFAKEFDTIAPALTELAPQRKIQVEAVARDSAALPCGDECSPTKATVLVFVDQARLVGSSKEPTVFANRISVSMVKRDGGWLVANIRAL